MRTSDGAYFDTNLQEELAAIQHRNEASLYCLFWPGSDDQNDDDCLAGGSGRNPSLFRQVSDRKYKRIYQRLVQPKNQKVRLLSKRQFAGFIKYEVTAVRATTSQVLRWLVPSGGSTESGRFGVKEDLEEILSREYFSDRYHDNADAAAKRLIALVANISTDHAMAFPPKARPMGERGYPLPPWASFRP